MAFGVVVNVFLARSLGPEGFGIVALGMTMVMVGLFLSSGLGAALIRREERPGPEELQSALGLQLLGTLGLLTLAGAAALTFGEQGLLVLVMTLAVPLGVLRMPAYVLLERELAYRVIALTDLAEGLFFYAWAVVAVAAGAGVWGVATAVVARAILGTLLVIWLGPSGFIRPRLDWAVTRPLVRFGLQYQAATAGGVGRDQGMNLGVAAVGGIEALGVWSLATRILQIPLMGMQSLIRVSYPAMSRLAGGVGDPAAAVERSIAMVATATAFLLVLIVSAAPAGLPPLVGDEWEAVPTILILAALGLMVVIPLGAAAIGYLFSIGRAGTVAIAAGFEAVAVLAVTLPLIPVVGIEVAGLSWVAVGVVDLVVLGRVVGRVAGARVTANLAVPFLIAVGAGAAGVLVSNSGGPALWRSALAAVVGISLTSVGFLTLKRDPLVAAIRMARNSLRAMINA